MKKVWVILADGFEDVEAITPIDYLRRAGIEVKLVGLDSASVSTSHGVRLEAEVLLKDVLDEVSSQLVGTEVSPIASASAGTLPDAIVLPGGLPGSKSLAASRMLQGLVQKVWNIGGIVSAICAAPALVLGSWGLLTDKKWTGYPGFGEDFANKPVHDRVVVDGNLITARAAGCAEEFSFALIEALCGKEVREKVSSDILAR